jgi:hypothetical protein
VEAKAAVADVWEASDIVGNGIDYSVFEDNRDDGAYRPKLHESAIEGRSHTRPTLPCPIISMRHRMKRNTKTARQPASKSSAWIDAKMQEKCLALEMEDVIGQRRNVEAARQPNIDLG